MDELTGLMQRAVEGLGGINDPAPWRQLATDKVMWGIGLYTLGIFSWFVSCCLRAFTDTEDQRSLQYTTALTWLVAGVTFFHMDMHAFSNEAKRASMTYQKVLADARGIVPKSNSIGLVPDPHESCPYDSYIMFNMYRSTSAM
jgi:hypothetical protein